MATSFLGKKHSITLDDAKKMIKKFKDEKDTIVKDEFKGQHLVPVCESFDRAPFDALLRREDCKGVRIYYGMKDGGKRVHAIIVGFDADGKDILPIAGIATDDLDPLIIEESLPCPTYCPPPSDLNG
jgi:hypothetical protein